jgi:hypothetical protein
MPILVVLSWWFISYILTKIPKIIPGSFQEMKIGWCLDLEILRRRTRIAAISKVLIRRHGYYSDYY